jgi:magnesium transporter
VSEPIERLLKSDELEQQAFRKLTEECSPQVLSEYWDLFDADGARRVFLALDLPSKVDLINLLPDDAQEDIITFLSEQNARLLLEEMQPDDLVDLMQSISQEVRRSVWEHLSDSAKKETLFLLRFDEDDAAGLMTPRYSAIPLGKTVAETIRFIRNNAAEAETIYYIYVVDKLNRLKGVLSIRQLLTSDDATSVSDIMAVDPVSVREDTDQEEVAHILESHDLVALPVVGVDSRLLGIVTVDDVIDVIREEQTEDVYKMGAMDGIAVPYMSTSILGLVKKRIPWLIVLLLLGTITTNVLHHYESIILGAAFLFIFMPVITQTGGNAGGQSSTLMIRGLATGEIQFRDFWRIMGRELAVGAILGACTSIVILLRSFLLPPGVQLEQAIAIGCALVFVVVFSTIVGTLAPLLISKLGFDPTVMSAPLMATLIDVAGITIYFEIARYLLKM